MLDHPVLDMHVHPPFPGAYTAEGLSYALHVNPGGAEAMQSLSDPEAFLAHFRGQGVDHVVLLAEEAPLSRAGRGR